MYTLDILIMCAVEINRLFVYLYLYGGGGGGNAMFSMEIILGACFIVIWIKWKYNRCMFTFCIMNNNFYNEEYNRYTLFGHVCSGKCAKSNFFAYLLTKLWKIY